MNLEVIGAGFGRTGTRSLKSALELLGYDKCYHMEELFFNPNQITHWENAENNNANWNQLFQGYTAAVDFPVSIYYKELATFYPMSKIILTVRDPESWYESVINTIYNPDPGIDKKLKLILKLPFYKSARQTIRIFKMHESTIWNGLFKGQFKNKNVALDIYKNHIDDVMKNIPSERLLMYNSEEGWEPLCKFLNKPIPQVNYPSSNKKENFREYVRSLV